MSNTQAHEEVTGGSDGITVTKRFEEDEFPVPAIAFEFASRREESVRVRLSDRVPNGVAVEDLGFHPEYGSQHWEIDDGTITFERELEAGAEYTTVYGIRATGTDDIAQFLDEPALEEVDPPLPEGASAVENGVAPDGDIVDQVVPSEDELTGREDDREDEPDGDDMDVGDLDLGDPTTSGSVDGTEAGAAVEVEDGVISALADEIRSGDVPVEDLELVGRALEKVVGDGGGSTDARVRQLQSEVADLRAYTNALEEFLDEEGTGEQLIEEFEAELATFGDRLDEIESGIDANTATVEDFEGTVDDLRSTVEDLEEEVHEGDVMDRIEDMESDVQDLVEWQEQIKKTFGGG
jgi:outer membrane murein-binding lipoprotein Lpp